jgi:hypothetical protein
MVDCATEDCLRADQHKREDLRKLHVLEVLINPTTHKIKIQQDQMMKTQEFV